MTPRDYLSYSQKALWKRSPKEYIQKYVYGKEQFETKELRYGKKMSNALEVDQETDDALLDLMIAQIPKFEKMEWPVSADLKVGGTTIPLYAQLDSAKENLSAFKEYKTGKNGGKTGTCGWNQRKADESDQITFYATLIYVKTRKIPEDIELVWVETEDSPHDPKEIVCTGNIHIFHTRRTMGQIINEMADIRKVWGEIQEAIKKELI